LHPSAVILKAREDKSKSSFFFQYEQKIFNGKKVVKIHNAAFRIATYFRLFITTLDPKEK
jgi:hypothetical protein